VADTESRKLVMKVVARSCGAEKSCSSWSSHWPFPFYFRK